MIVLFVVIIIWSIMIAVISIIYRKKRTRKRRIIWDISKLE